MLKISISFLLLSFCMLLSCSQKNIEALTVKPKSDSVVAVMIHESRGGFGPCEPSICINHKDPDNIIGGAILDYVYTSYDGGKHWIVDKLKSTLGVYGDPVLCSDYEGNIYYAHLSNPSGRVFRDDSWLDRIVIQKSTDKGRTWNDGSFTKPRSPKDQDKHWLAVDPESNHIYITWTEFDKYGSRDEKHKSRILFSRSVDEGESWSHPISISQFEGNCIDDDQTPEGAVPSVGVNGEVYVAWSYDEKIYFDKSLDGGVTWLDKDIPVVDQPEGWAIDIPGIMRCNGMPITGVDRSGGPNHGTLYINWSDQRNGEHDTDIWLVKSTDGGMNWSDPVRVNDDLPGKHQFFTWMDVDEKTGAIYIVFYDRRNHEDETTDVYLAYSSDGGMTFTNMKINSKSFKPNPAVFFGDYNDISAINGRVRPIWTQLDDKILSVWTALLEF
ncbi:MAG: glycoside hydrolase [Bacteroidia bacterium]|nr:glycoside hydrolase [Bacteroidia bacterium]MBT8229907.1 glycoside hydrolase [Bacteroidia bacterium]